MGSDHPVFQCPNFMALSVASRRELVQRWNLCFNCLSAKHKVDRCPAGSCRRCGNNEKHNNILCSKLRSAVQVVTKTERKKRGSESSKEDTEQEKKK